MTLTIKSLNDLRQIPPEQRARALVVLVASLRGLDDLDAPAEGTLAFTVDLSRPRNPKWLAYFSPA